MSIDDFSAAISIAIDQIDQLAAAISSAKSVGDELSGQFAGLGADGKSEQTDAVTQRLEVEAAVQAAQLQSTLEEIQGQTAGLRSNGLQGATRRASSTQPALRPSATTRPSLPFDPERQPGGTPTLIPPRASALEQADIRAENNAASTLARNGYKVEQNPPPKPNGKNPDYRVEDEYWDCYTVHTGNPERVRKSVKAKVNPKDGHIQADRIVLNLDADTPSGPTTVTPGEIEALLQRKPLTGLKEVKVVKDGRVHDLDLGG